MSDEEKQNKGQLWEKGQSGNPKGRPKGARSILSETYLKAMLADFEQHGTKAIEELRQKSPKEYLNLIAKIIEKVPFGDVTSITANTSNVLVVKDHGSDDDWKSKAAEQQQALLDEARKTQH